jgi:hypothetical protein
MFCRAPAFPGDRFKLVSGKDVLTSYGFNTQTAKHLFCSVCGIKSFYVPRSGINKRRVRRRALLVYQASV